MSERETNDWGRKPNKVCLKMRLCDLLAATLEFEQLSCSSIIYCLSQVGTGLYTRCTRAKSLFMYFGVYVYYMYFGVYHCCSTSTTVHVTRVLQYYCSSSSVLLLLLH